MNAEVLQVAFAVDDATDNDQGGRISLLGRHMTSQLNTRFARLIRSCETASLSASIYETFDVTTFSGKFDLVTL